MPRPIGGERGPRPPHLGPPHGPKVGGSQQQPQQPIQQQPPEPTAGFQAAAAEMAASGLWTAYNQDLAAAEWLSQVSSVLTSTVVTSSVVTSDPGCGRLEDSRPRSHPNHMGSMPGGGSGFPVDPGSMDRAVDSSFGPNANMSGSNAAAVTALFNGLPPQVAAMFSQAAATDNMWNPAAAQGKSLDTGQTLPGMPPQHQAPVQNDAAATAAAQQAAKMMWSNWSNAPGNL